MSIIFFILVLAWWFLVIGTGIELYIILDRRVANPVPGKKFFYRFIRPVWVLWLLLAIIVTFGPKLLQGYYDYFMAELNSQLLISIGLGAWFFLGLISVADKPPYISDKSLSILVVCTSIFIFIVATFLTLPRAGQQIQALITGPNFNMGIVQRKYQDYIARGGTVYYVHVNNYQYQTPDADWYETIRVGEPLEYAYSPFVTFLTPEIFDPQKSGFSALGIAIVSCGCFLWFVGILFAVDGWLSILRLNTAH